MIKNSNVIKKVGKILIDHSDKFENGENNPGYKQMWNALSKISKKSQRDKFNTSHLQLMVDYLDT